MEKHRAKSHELLNCLFLASGLMERPEAKIFSGISNPVSAGIWSLCMCQISDIFVRKLFGRFLILDLGL